ncbi:putative lipoprotein [Pedobacter sp. AK017]|uniref:hypothetical protein n=1 Tax=Pedobacter sp. AK017 TaxID=2723073 RepID=UPI00160F407C|nr:hypothetical protein [Pedobacter sp. AK017]MBB5438124.1 putative lipoprotein [Pedobacter sp. AK017]
MGYENIISQLQRLYFGVEDLSYDNFDHREGASEIISQYNRILTTLYQQHAEVFENLLQIGVNELLDHLALLDNNLNVDNRKEYFDDLKFYLQESILEARSKVKSLGS